MKHWADEYVNSKKLRPITKDIKETTRKAYARYIFIHDKEGNGNCQYCQRELNFGKTKHLQRIVCPKCRKELTVQHEWRMSKYLDFYGWISYPTVLDENTVCLRYVMYYLREKDIIIREKARMIVSSKYANACYYEHNYYTDSYEYGKRYYFVYSYMGYGYNKRCCLQADLYTKNLYKELNKLECFKYSKAEENFDFEKNYLCNLHYIVRYVSFTEKCNKAGFNALSESHLKYYINNGDKGYKGLKLKESSLKRILDVNAKEYNWLKNHQDIYHLMQLHNAKKNGVDVSVFIDSNIDLYEISTYTNLCKITGHGIKKIHNYIKRQGIASSELLHYYKTLNMENITLDSSYMFPKNFRKMENDINRSIALRNAEKDNVKTEKIKKISDAIRNNKELLSWLNGSNGLKIFVPESVADLALEGMNLHNCIGTYVNRIISKEVLLFFIRKIEDPDSSYVAFEYRNGAIQQIREDYNVEVEDNNIIDFAERFVAKLNDIRIMEQLKKIG